jgi:hypothetical protein
MDGTTLEKQKEFEMPIKNKSYQKCVLFTDQRPLVIGYFFCFWANKL